MNDQKYLYEELALFGALCEVASDDDLRAIESIIDDEAREKLSRAYAEYALITERIKNEAIEKKLKQFERLLSQKEIA